MPSNSTDTVVIVDAARTPMGGFQGDLAALSAPELGAHAIRASLTRAGLANDCVDEVFMGCVLPAGLGQAPARQAALGAGLDTGTPCTTINKMCGSGMKALMLAHDALIAGTGSIMIAGGMESMSNAPYLMPSLWQGRYGHRCQRQFYFRWRSSTCTDAPERSREAQPGCESTRSRAYQSCARTTVVYDRTSACYRESTAKNQSQGIRH